MNVLCVRFSKSIDSFQIHLRCHLTGSHFDSTRNIYAVRKKKETSLVSRLSVPHQLWWWWRSRWKWFSKPVKRVQVLVQLFKSFSYFLLLSALIVASFCFSFFSIFQFPWVFDHFPWMFKRLDYSWCET